MMKKTILLICILMITFVYQFYRESNYIIQPFMQAEQSKYIDVPLICQYPSLPTGCESVATTMVLQYYNSDITAEEFVLEWLNCSENFYYDGNILYGPNPNEVFTGNPFSYSSYGCYSYVIEKAINTHSTTYHAQSIIGQDLKALCDQYINHNQPLLIWATMGMRESKKGDSWTLENGESYTWVAGEHCLVLIGYDENNYFLNDPQTGTTVAYEKTLVEKRYQELGSQAVFIYPH